jgi:Family of unknown function (DUF6529)
VTASSRPQTAGTTAWPLAIIGAAGALVALSVGTYAHLHTPAVGAPTFGFDSPLEMKAWFTTGAAVLAIFQLVTALWMWGRLPLAGSAPGWVGNAHRLSGTLAFLVILPVAYHCLWSLGFSTADLRTTVHSIVGCAFFGAFAAKMLSLRLHPLPGWALPLLGGTVFSAVVVLWCTASLWYFTTVA